MPRINFSQEERERYRRQRMDEFEASVNDLINTWKERPEELAEYLRFKNQFYQYSVRNTMLIYRQNPHAEFVGAFKWFKERGYSVRAGEHGMGIMAYAPVILYRLKPDAAWHKLSGAPQSVREMVEAGMIETREEPHFKVGTVFDISQTDCPLEDYPKLLGLGYSSEQHAAIYRAACAYSTNIGLPVTETSLQSVTLRGDYDPESHAIRINSVLGDTQKLSTLLHEMAHGIMGHQIGEKSSAQRELEADLLSIMLCNRYGIEVTDARKDHMVSSFRTFEAEQENAENPIQLISLIESVDRVFTRHENGLQKALETAGVQPQAEQEKPAVSQSPELRGEESVPEPAKKTEQEAPVRAPDQSAQGRQGRSGRGISKETVEEIKARASLLDVARERIQLTKRGGNYVGCCPFHNEKTPSFTIYPQSNSFYCYGCGEGGDVITFIRKLDGLTYPEAVQRLAERAGVEISTADISASQAEKELQNRIRECNREAARFFFQTLKKSPAGSTARKYLMGDRGMPEGSIRHFGIGYATDGFFDLVNHLRKMGFTDQEMIEANVAFESKAGRLVDRFRERIMFPIFDSSGNVIGFGGRALGDEKPKYLNTNTTPVFQKSNELFALNFARKSRSDQIILAEGYMDVIALHTAGFTNSVASLGTALTEQHARILARYAKEVVICYDSDEAGQKATLKAISVLRANHIKVRVARIPDAKDPDEFLKHYPQDGKERLQAIFDAAPNDTEYRLAQCKNGLDMETPAGKLAYMEAAVGVLASLTDAIERDIYADLLSHETGVSKESILQQTGTERRENRNPVPVSEAEPAPADEPTQRFHAWIRPDMNEESSIVAWADVVINEDFRINSVRLVLEENDTFSLLMPAYKPRGKEDFIPLVEMDAAVEHELTRFLVQNLDTTKAVEVVGGGTAIDVGETKMELHKVHNRGSIVAYADMENDIVKLKSAKIINGGKGIFLAPPDSGRIKTEDGKEQYRYVYEFASTSVKSAATAAAKQAYSRMQDQNERVSYARFKTKEV